MSNKSILQRLERLEQMAQTDDGVAILELMPSGEWELMIGEKRSIHPTQEAGREAHKEFLQKCKNGTKDPVLIIIDI